MKRSRKAQIAVAVAGLLAALAVFEGSRGRCDRLMPKILPRLLSAFSEGTAESLWLRLTAVRSDLPAYGFETDDVFELRIPGDSQGNRWRDVQSGALAVIPPLDLVVVTLPYWADDRAQFLEDFQSQDPATMRLGRADSETPPFLLVQLGGGVEDLLLQALVVREREQAMVWILRASGDYQRLPEPTVIALPAATVARLFSLAAKADLAAQSAVEWRCETLDGSVHAFVFFDGERLGRVSYVNNRQPSPDLQDLLTALLEAAGIERRAGEYRLAAARPGPDADAAGSPLD